MESATCSTPLRKRKTSSKKRGAEIVEASKRHDKFVFSTNSPKKVDKTDTQENGKPILYSRRKGRYGRQSNCIHSNEDPLSSRTLQEINTSSKGSREHIALSPICFNVLGAIELPKIKLDLTTKAAQKFRNKSVVTPQRYISESQGSKSSSSSDERQTLPHATRTFLWSNAVFCPGLLDREHREDSNSALRFPIHHSQKNRLSICVTHSHQELSMISKEIQEMESYSADMDSDCSPAVSSNASESPRSSVDKFHTNRQRNTNDESGIASEACPYSTIRDASKSFRGRSAGSEKPVNHHAARKTLFNVGHLKNRGESICKASHGKPALPPTKTSKPRNAVRAESRSIVNTIQEPVHTANMGTVVENSAVGDGNRQNIPQDGLDSGIDEIEEEIQRLTKRLAELQLQQAAKRQRQGRSYTADDDEKRLTEVAGKQLTQGIEETRGVVIRQRQGTNSFPQTPSSKFSQQQHKGTSPQGGEFRKGWKGIGTISCPQTPVSNIALKQQKNGIDRGSQIAEQNKVRKKGRVISAKFLQWDSNANQMQDRSKNPTDVVPGKSVSPILQRRCVSLGAAASPLKGRTVPSSFANSPTIKDSEGSRRKNIQVEDARRAFKKEDLRTDHGGQEEACVRKGKESVRRLSLTPSSIISTSCNGAAKRGTKFDEHGGQEEACVRRGTESVRRLSLTPSSIISTSYNGATKRGTKFDEHRKEPMEERDNKAKVSFNQPAMSTPRTARFVASRYGQLALATDGGPCHVTRSERSPSIKKTRAEKRENSEMGSGISYLEKRLHTSPVLKKFTVRSGYPSRSGLSPLKDNSMKIETSNRYRLATEQSELAQKEDRLIKKRRDACSMIRSHNLGDLVPGEIGKKATEEEFELKSPSRHQCLEPLIKDRRIFLLRNPQNRVSSDEDHEDCRNHLSQQGAFIANIQEGKTTPEKLCIFPQYSMVSDSMKLFPSPEIIENSCSLASERKVLRRINTGRLKTVSPRDSGCVKRMADLEKKHMHFHMESFDLQMQFEQGEGQLTEAEVESKPIFAAH